MSLQARIIQDQNLIAEEKSGRDIKESSKIWDSEYKVQSQNGPIDGSSAQIGNSAAQSNERDSEISNGADSAKASISAKNASVRSKDKSSRDVLHTDASKNVNTETNGIAKPNQAASDNNTVGSTDGVMLVGSSGSNKYHRPDCRFVAKIRTRSISRAHRMLGRITKCHARPAILLDMVTRIFRAISNPGGPWMTGDPFNTVSLFLYSERLFGSDTTRRAPANTFFFCRPCANSSMVLRIVSNGTMA